MRRIIGKVQKVSVLITGILIYSGSLNGQTLPETHPKFRVTWQVYTQLAASFGSHRPRPALVIISKQSSKRVIARYIGGRIEIDELLYDLCHSFGADSLAALSCVLGHELAHYYLNHSISDSFSYLLSAPSDRNSQPHALESRTQEAQADYHGVFHGFLVGYDTYRIVPELYEQIYRHYHLPEAMPGYPTKTERLALAREKAREIAHLAPLLETARFLFVKGDYYPAARCYRYLLEQLPTQQLYNNLGVCYLQQASEYFPSQQGVFAYPFEIDPANRLFNLQARGSENLSSPELETLLRQAEENFQQAIRLDNFYASAYINLATVQTLQGVPSAAIGTIDLLQKNNPEPLPANAYLARGIARVFTRQLELASEDFEKAVSGNAFQASYNQALYQRLRQSWWDGLVEWVGQYFTPEPLATKAKPMPSLRTLGDFHQSESSFFTPIIALPYPEPLILTQCPSHTKTHLKIETASQQIELMHSGMVANGPWKGKSLQQWLGRFRVPDLVLVSSGEHRMHLYRQSRIILETRNDQIIGWFVWQSTPLGKK